MLLAPAPAPERAATPPDAPELTPTAIEAAATLVSTRSALALARLSAPCRSTVSACISAATAPLSVFDTSTAPMLAAPLGLADRPRAMAKAPAPRRAINSRLRLPSSWASSFPLPALIVALLPPFTVPAFTVAVTGAVMVLVLPAPPPARGKALLPSA